MNCMLSSLGRIVLGLYLVCAVTVVAADPPLVERWGLFEHTLAGPQSGNPFQDVTLSAEFSQGQSRLTVHGFYDGDGRYVVRFSPPMEGLWTYRTACNVAELDGRIGQVLATPPSPTNHGPVGVAHLFHFAYADGTPYRQLGTTCYAWTHQPAELEERTLAALKAAPFNKLRMCVFPKHYEYNSVEPTRFPFPGGPNSWDTTRFSPEFFRHLEQRIVQLQELGIEADLILFHPYDDGHWGFDRMAAAEDDRYLRYVIDRLSAYRNVWWSLANEFDFMERKTDADWDRFFQIIAARDPYVRLRSIHNGTRLYNHNHPWVTHASIQNGSAVADYGRAVLYRDAYRKPIVFDEVKYEGNLPQRWGNLSAEEMVHRFWIGTIEGTYVGHGETYLHPDQEIWWAKGGTLRGESPPRLAFLRQVLDAGPREGYEPIDKWQESRMGGSHDENHYLVYLGKSAVKEWRVSIPTKARLEGSPLPSLKAEILDAWNMTITPVDGVLRFEQTSRYEFTCPDRPTLPVPERPYQAIRLTPASR